MLTFNREELDPSGTPRLCIDIDNVLARTDEVVRELIRRHTRGRVDLRAEHVIEYDYCLCTDARGNSITLEEWDAVHGLFSQRECLLEIEPVEAAAESLVRLSERYELYLVTGRSPVTRGGTLEWLARHGFPPADLHYAPIGEKHAALGPFHAAVEDHYEQAVAFGEAGTPCYLIRHPWNERKAAAAGIVWAADWRELTEALLK